MGRSKDRNITLSLDSLTWSGAQLPPGLPLPKPVAKSKEYFMSAGSTGPGIRVVDPLGAHVSYQNVEFRVDLLSSLDIATLETYFAAQRTVRTYTVTTPSVSTHIYKVLFADDGFEPFIYTKVDYDEDQAYFAVLKLRILEKIS